MKKFSYVLSFFILAELFLISCQQNSSGKNNVADSTDTVASKKIELPVSNEDSIPIDISKSEFDCTRSKTVKDVDQEVVLFGKTMSVKMDNASFSASVAIQFIRANWFTKNKKFDGGKIFLDMKSVATMQVGKNKELEMSNPDYLDVKNYPTAMLQIFSIEKLNDTSDVKSGQFNVKANLTLKDSTAEIIIDPKMVKCSYTENNQIVPEKLSFDFHIDGKAWGLNRKNAKVVKDDLLFHVVLVTKK